LLHEREADPQSIVRVVALPLALEEELEDLRHHLLRHAEAVISHRDDGIVPLAASPEIDAPAVLLELGRVVQEVGDDLGKPRRVGVDLRPGTRGD
jgi:hypothetical protein